MYWEGRPGPATVRTLYMSFFPSHFTPPLPFHSFRDLHASGSIFYLFIPVSRIQISISVPAETSQRRCDQPVDTCAAINLAHKPEVQPLSPALAIHTLQIRLLLLLAHPVPDLPTPRVHPGVAGLGPGKHKDILRSRLRAGPGCRRGRAGGRRPGKYYSRRSAIAGALCRRRQPRCCA